MHVTLGELSSYNLEQTDREKTNLVIREREERAPRRGPDRLRLDSCIRRSCRRRTPNATSHGELG